MAMLDANGTRYVFEFEGHPDRKFVSAGLILLELLLIGYGALGNPNNGDLSTQLLEGGVVLEDPINPTLVPLVAGCCVHMISEVLLLDEDKETGPEILNVVEILVS
ncbi:hypothetical protein K3495_g4025 [Podosphaera aphanis]|nr:hypothetical protein K3495_g4025 [Podosphaera aphanis]